MSTTVIVAGILFFFLAQLFAYSVGCYLGKTKPPGKDEGGNGTT